MQEIKNLASTLTEAFSLLKKIHSDANGNLNAELTRAHENATKVKSLIQGLKEANEEVESFLGTTNTNYPPVEVPAEEFKQKTDINGVTLLGNFK
jgi:hypothetical protein